MGDQSEHPGRRSRSRILVRLASAADRVSIAAAWPTFDVVGLYSEPEFIEALTHPSVIAAVCELSSAITISPQFVVHAHNRQICAPILVRTALTPGTARDLMALANGPLRVHASLIGYDDLRTGMLTIIDSAAVPTAEQLIIARIPAKLDARARQTVIAAAIAARRRTTVSRIAGICGYSKRGLELCMRRAGCPSAAAVIGWATSLHTLWRIEYVDSSIKTAAAVAGFASTSSLSNYMCRHIGIRPSHAAAVGGFWELLRRFEATLVQGTASKGDSRDCSSTERCHQIVRRM